MKEETISLTRQELYEQVWSEPIVHLSKLYNLSDVSFSKICKKMDIPVPGRGYWEKKYHGHNAERTALPPFKGPGNGKIRITIREKNDDIDDEFQDRIVFEGLPENHISVKSSLKNPHRLVERTEVCLKKTKPDHKGLLYTYERDCLDLVVGPRNLDRALKIYDTLIKACEARGYAVSVSNLQRAVKTIVNVLGENLEIGIRERYTEKKSNISQGRSSVYQLREYGPSGSLSLLIKNAWHAKQKSWNDGRCQVLEDCLNDFMEGLVHAAASEKAIREKREREERERREGIRLYEQARKEREEEQAKIEKLRQEATDWHEAQRIRNYIAAVKEKVISNGDEIHPDSDLGRWFTWANQQADRLDPVESHGISPLNAL